MKHFFYSITICFATIFFASAQFSLPALPYKYSALEPAIDSTTMFIHLNNHHAAYVNNLNKALEKYPDLKSKSIEELMSKINKLPQDIQAAVRNNGGGHYNHSLFWKMLAPVGSTKISDQVEEKLANAFGSVDEFKSKFEAASVSRFGSGWVWLIKNKKGNLEIVTTPNQDNTLMDVVKEKGQPILALDVWEHAYYLKYQSKRAGYVKAFWSVVNWNEVDRLMKN